MLRLRVDFWYAHPVGHEDLPELLEGARLLIEKRLSYDDALRGYFPRLLEAYGGDRSKVFAFDGIDWQYI